MKLLALSIVLTLHFSGGQVTSWQLNVNPVLQIDRVPAWLPGPHDRGLTAMSLPSVVLMAPHEARFAAMPGSAYHTIIREELRHQEQMTALGPWFWVAYGATLGRPFEPYGNSKPPTNDYAAALPRMWMPPLDMQHRCPLFQISGSADGSGRMALMPCYSMISLSSSY